MSELAQRIVTSHKEAAKRAVLHLGKTRKLKMASAESLELVACVLGVANWQTLLAIAKEGRGPRIDDGKSVALAAASVAEKSIAEQLADHYCTDDSWGEHPTHTREEWRDVVSNDDTLLGYWAHVENEICNRKEMLPWEREASFDVKVTKIAGLAVEYNGPDWSLVDPRGKFYIEESSSEVDCWQRAADAVLERVLFHENLRLEQWNKMSEEVRLAKVGNGLWRRL